MSASPASSTDDQPKGQEQIKFRFCRECSNMLYPKEDRMSNTLMFACRTCQFAEPAISSCVFRNNLYNTVGETAGVTQDVGSDPTVGVPDFCTLCGQEIMCLVCSDANDSPVSVQFDVASLLTEFEDSMDEDPLGEDSLEESSMEEMELDQEQTTGAAEVEQAMPKLQRDRSGVFPISTALCRNRNETVLRLLQLWNDFSIGTGRLFCSVCIQRLAIWSPRGYDTPKAQGVGDLHFGGWNFLRSHDTNKRVLANVLRMERF